MNLQVKIVGLSIVDPDLNDILNESESDEDASGDDDDSHSDSSSPSSSQPPQKQPEQPKVNQGKQAIIQDTSANQSDQEESKHNQESPIVFEDINAEDFFEAQRENDREESGKSNEPTQQRKSIRDKFRNGAGLKSFVTSTLDRGMKVVQNLKDNVSHMDPGHLIFTGQEKKAVQKRLSEDLTTQQMSGSKAEAQLIKSAENSASNNDQIEQQVNQAEDEIKNKLDLDQALKSSENQEDKEGNDESDKDQESSDEDIDIDGDDDSDVSERERLKILADIDKDDDDDDEDDDENSDSLGELSNVKDDDNNSVISDDIANRSLNAEDEDSMVIMDSQNYLRYVSDKYNISTDVLEAVDRNERSFKQVAERLISKTSYLIQPISDVTLGTGSILSNDDQASHGAPTARRLMHTKILGQISQKYHADPKAQLGFPYSIAAYENYIAIGSSDGSIRIFDNSEREYKVLFDKGLKNIAVMCLDMKRSRNNNLFVISGHTKGQMSLYEVKGLKAYSEVNMTLVSSKHHKTISDIHSQSIIALKFVGELGPGVQTLTTVSCDLDGVVYICLFKEGMMGYQCNKQCFMRKRVGPTFSIAPLLQFSYKSIDAIIAEQLQNQIENGGSGDQVDFTRKKPQIVAFGALERIILAQMRPVPKELMYIDRPDYIEIGTVPYLDWGMALSPCFRDKSYPCLAIGWGKVLQLAIYVNYEQPEGIVQEQPQIQFDGYYVCEHTIDACFFLSESILFILVNKKEVRILYTQNLTPGVFDETYQLNDPTRPKTTSRLLDPVERTKYFMSLREHFNVSTASSYAEKDKNYRLLSEEIRFKDLISPATQQRSKYNYNPTLCKNQDNMVLALGKTSVGYGKLLHWEEYLLMIRKTNQDDWLKVLRASLDIFNGKMTGLAGLPDQKETREEALHEKMKHLLRQNIDACIREFQEGDCVSNKTLRVALEFCIRVNAIDHLFGELFQMFAEAGMEQRFFENLEPFILSGKFKQTMIPMEVLVRMIGFYQQKDTELLEKALLNIDLSQYDSILEVRHICETEFLTSALIHILTNLFDKDSEVLNAIQLLCLQNTVCLQLLCSLYNMMTKSRFQQYTKQDVFRVLTYDPSKDQKTRPLFLLEEEQKSSNRTSETTDNSQTNISTKVNAYINKWQKFEIEQSATYIGYKLMWVMKMFLEGKKFPQGTLSAFKWRIYVYDIVRFATNERFMNWFLEFDPETFFKLMKQLFTDQEPYEYIVSQKAFIEMYKDQINGLDECMTHTQIIDQLQKAIVAYLAKDKDANNGYLSPKGECALNSYIFFIAQISRKPQVVIPTDMCVYVIKEQLKFSRKLLKIPNLLNDDIIKLLSMNTKPIVNLPKQDKISKVYNYFIKKNEKDVVALLLRCEKDLDEEELQDLKQDAERSPMYKVRVSINQILGNYEECLQLFFKIPTIREDVFSWLQEIQKHIRRDYQGQQMMAQLKALFVKSISQFVDMDSTQTLKLAQQWLDNDHMKIIVALKDQNDQIFKYLNTLLAEKEPEIEKEFNTLLMQGGRLQSKMYDDYKELIVRFVKVLCEKKYRCKLAEYVKKKYYPVDECLDLIQSIDEDASVKKSTKIKEDTQEAQAILYKRKGEYLKSIDFLNRVLIELSVSEVTSALYLDANIKFNDPSMKNEHIAKFDSLIQFIINMCDKYGSRLPEDQQEALWLHAIKSLYKIKQVVFERMRQNLGAKDQDKFSTFHMIRIQEFMRRMSEHVNLRKILEFLDEIGHQIKYQEFRQTFEDKVRTELHHENILTNAKHLLINDLIADTVQLKKLYQKGAPNQKERCDYCKRELLYKWDIQNVYIFSCGHIFHQRCVANTDYKCYLCFSEYDQILSIMNQRGARRGVHKKSKDLDAKDDNPHKKRKSLKDSDMPKNLNQKSQKVPEKSPKDLEFDMMSKVMNKFENDLKDKIIHFSAFN